MSHRIDARSKPELVGPARGDVVTSLCARPGAPGVLGDDGEVVVGWAAVTRAGEYVGAGALFERAGFAMVADTTAVSGGFFRMVMRLELRR